jgi:hypothetical protein
MKDVDSTPSALSDAAVKVRLLGIELTPMALICLLGAVILALVIVLLFAACLLEMVLNWSGPSGIESILKAIFR